MRVLEPSLGLASELGGFSLAARGCGGGVGEEGRQDRLALHRPIGTAPRDLDRVVERLGKVGEQLAHLGAGLEIMLGAQAAPVVDGDIASLGDADQSVMRLEILLGGEIGLVGGDDGKIEIVSEAEQSRLDAALLRQAVALQLDIEPVAEHRLQCLEPAAGELRVSFGEREIDDPFRSAGERDQAFGVGGEIGDSGDHLAGLGGGEIGVGREAHQIGVTGRHPWREARCDRRRGGRVSSPPTGLTSFSAAKVSDRVSPMMGWIPTSARALENSSAPNRLLELVRASAGAPSALASAASFGMVSAPSSSE